MSPATATVLLVDANGVDAELTLLALRLDDARTAVFWARDSAEALACIRVQVPNLVLLCARLPDASALAVAVRAEHHAPRTPIVLMLPSDGSQHLDPAAFAPVANSCVKKPSDPHKFASAMVSIVRYWLDLHVDERRRA